MLYVNFLTPLLISILYINPLLETYIVPEYMSESVFRVIRVAIVVMSICLRMLTFREELQFVFNESYFMVQKLMVEKNEKVFRYIKLRIQENFLNTWYTVYQ